MTDQPQEPRDQVEEVFPRFLAATRKRDIDRLLKAVRRVERADIEYTRAQQLGEQPRLQKAGTRYWLAHNALYKLAEEIRHG